MGTQFLGHVYFKTSSSPILGQDELCNIELSFRCGLLDVMLSSELAHKWTLSLHFLVIWDQGDVEFCPTSFRKTKETTDRPFIEIILLRKNDS